MDKQPKKGEKYLTRVMAVAVRSSKEWQFYSHYAQWMIQKPLGNLWVWMQLGVSFPKTTPLAVATRQITSRLRQGLRERA